MAGNVGGGKTKQQNLYARVLAEINAGKRSISSLPVATQKGVKEYRAMRAGKRQVAANNKQYTDSRIKSDQMVKDRAALRKKQSASAGTALNKIRAGKAKMSDYSKPMQTQISKYRTTQAGKRVGVPKAVQKINSGKASITQYSPGTQARIRKTRAEGAAKRAAATKKASKPVTGRPGR
jgi:hypothetical protein